MKNENYFGDSHLNIFYSYDSGSKNSFDQLRQLEDNITRSFIITLSHLSKENQIEFIKKLLSIDNINHNPQIAESFYFDLQNLSNNYRNKIRNSKFKFLLLISHHKSSITKENLLNWKKFNKKNVIPNSNELKKELNNDFKQTDSQAKLELRHDDASRPDAWIFNDRIAFLVESKIGNNLQNIDQVYRHLTNSNGLNLKPNSEYEVINVSWKDIIKLLLEVSFQSSREENFFVNQFKEYLIMLGEIFSFEPIISGNNNNFTFRSATLKLLVKEISARIDNDPSMKSMKLAPNRKSISGHAWQQLGLDKNKHFSIYIWENSIGIDLTFREKFLNKIIENWNNFYKLLWDSFLNKGLSNIMISHRYQLYIKEYHIFDHYTGLQNSSLNRDEFNMEFDMEWAKRHNFDYDSFSEFLFGHFKYIFPKTEQFGIKYIIPYPNLDEKKRREDLNKPKDRLQKDYDLLSDEDKVINNFVQFISDMKPIFELFHSRNISIL